LFRSTGQLANRRLRLLHPEARSYAAEDRGRDGDVLVRVLPPADLAAELAETEVTVGDKRPHAARLGDGQRLPVLCLSALGIEPLRMGRDVAYRWSAWPTKPGRDEDDT
jgi:hypothetical protein